ncbi:MAG: DUF2188 domain-containing protein [Phycisphaerales bacterium]
MAKRDYHVVKDGDDWAVKREGGQRASSKRATQREAIEDGRRLAQQAKTELVIHRPDGRIRDSDSYGNDPRSIRDRKH